MNIFSKDGNQRATHCCLCNIVCFLTMCVEKGENFALSNTGTQQPRCDEALPLWLPHYTDNLQLKYIFLQLGLQVLWRNKNNIIVSVSLCLRLKQKLSWKGCLEKVVLGELQQLKFSPCCQCTWIHFDIHVWLQMQQNVSTCSQTNFTHFKFTTSSGQWCFLKSGVNTY